MVFDDLFHAATGHKPYPYQLTLSTGAWPELITIPTGLGKTAAVILSWLWRRINSTPGTPRRLIYCLPMRVLVEQTRDEASRWMEILSSGGYIPAENKPQVFTLMGGEVDLDWDAHPEKDAILVGTQDQLLSRALNRGYAMSRYRWPISFGLLNNDCLWVMDEVQLMGNGVATTAQMQAFRERFGMFLPTLSTWMTATQQPKWLETVDFKSKSATLQELVLSTTDRENPVAKVRLNAPKKIERLQVAWDKTANIAQAIIDAHNPKTLTLVVVNTVDRARSIYDSITKNKQYKKCNPAPELLLIHSRFRPPDRAEKVRRLQGVLGPGGKICIATQVVEAGVNISASTLLTDIAPWAALVQRFGRCNRFGEVKKARILWIPLPRTSSGEIKDKAVLPYEMDELDSAEKIIGRLDDGAPSSLPRHELPIPYVHVIRSKDVVDLFDTTPNLAGMDTDISHFIRETDDHDLQVFWRKIAEKEAPSPDEPGPSRDELCSVSISEIRNLRKTKRLDAWLWDSLDDKWAPANEIYPGMVLMLRQADGGYDGEMGWTGEDKHIPVIFPQEQNKLDADGRDFETSADWQTISEHTGAVVEAIESICESLDLPQEFREHLADAARWHDIGKSHPVFAEAIALLNPPDPSVLWAKTGVGTRLQYKRNGRTARGFRHELASALAMLQNGLPDLIAYLAAAHHGKIRLSIRSFPHETRPDDPDMLFARGIWDGDILPEVHLEDGVRMPSTILDMSYMGFGQGQRGASWVSRMIGVRDAIGIFRLAYLESLLRIADWRGSDVKRSIA